MKNNLILILIFLCSCGTEKKSEQQSLEVEQTNAEEQSPQEPSAQISAKDSIPEQISLTDSSQMINYVEFEYVQPDGTNQILKVTWLSQDSVKWEIFTQTMVGSYENYGIAVLKEGTEVDEDANGISYLTSVYEVVDAHELWGIRISEPERDKAKISYIYIEYTGGETCPIHPYEVQMNKTHSSYRQNKYPIIDFQHLLDDTIPVPSDKIFLQKADGDLDKDGCPERVIVYDTKNYNEDGSEREICIYKIINNNWVLWHKSSGAVLPLHCCYNEEEDPLESIYINNNELNISHGIYHSWEINFTHTYRFIGENLKLIQFYSNEANEMIHFQQSDYNLLTGDIYILNTHKNENEEEIDDECLFNVKLDYLPDIKSIDLRENDVTGDCDYEFRY